jgi:hypothetical protein
LHACEAKTARYPAASRHSAWARPKNGQTQDNAGLFQDNAATPGLLEMLHSQCAGLKSIGIPSKFRESLCGISFVGSTPNRLACALLKAARAVGERQ